jgi:hypothetical protein
MNQRYKTLWEKAATASAAFSSGQNNSWETQVNFMEQYTELVVQESIDVMMRHDYHGQWLGEKIKQHFGIDQ